MTDSMVLRLLKMLHGKRNFWEIFASCLIPPNASFVFDMNQVSQKTV